MTNRPAHNSIRVWAVAVWLLVWQGASMAFAALWPHGELLLASPLAVGTVDGDLQQPAAGGILVFQLGKGLPSQQNCLAYRILRVGVAVQNGTGGAEHGMAVFPYQGGETLPVVLVVLHGVHLVSCCPDVL